MRNFSHSTNCFIEPDVPITIEALTSSDTAILRFGEVMDNVTVFLERGELERLARVIGDFLDANQVEAA